MLVLPFLLLACAPSPTHLLSVSIEGGDVSATWWDEGSPVVLRIPERVTGFDQEVGVVRSDGRRVRIVGRLMVWDEDRRLRYTMVNVDVDTAESTVHVIDRDLVTGQETRCLRASGTSLRGVRWTERDVSFRALLHPRSDCSAPAPTMDCTGSVPRIPDRGIQTLPPSPGMLDPLMNGETAAQERSWMQPSVARVVLQAARDTACVGAARGWDGTGWPLVIGDRSMVDGSIPTFDDGTPSHPYGSHTNGWDADIAYYQRGYAPDNDMRPVCPHGVDGQDERTCTGAPTTLDVRRTALFVGLVTASPRVRCVGVDGRIGPLLEQAQRILVEQGQLPAMSGAKLCFERVDEGRGWYRGHHDHLHVSGTP